MEGNPRPKEPDFPDAQFIARGLSPFQRPDGSDAGSSIQKQYFGGRPLALHLSQAFYDRPVLLPGEDSEVPDPYAGNRRVSAQQVPGTKGNLHGSGAKQMSAGPLVPDLQVVQGNARVQKVEAEIFEGNAETVPCGLLPDRLLCLSKTVGNLPG